MFCRYCGAEISDYSKFCGKCGKPMWQNMNNGESITDQDAVYEDAYNDQNTADSTEDDFVDPFANNSESSDRSYPSFSQIKSSVKKVTESAKKTAPDLTQIKDSVKDFATKTTESASKVASQAKDAAIQTKERIDKNIEDGVNKEINKANSEKNKKEGLVSGEFQGDNYMSTTELWTWLKKDSKRQQFYTEDISAETEEQYIEELTQKLSDNYIPVKIEKREIAWDRSDAKENVYVAVPDTKVVNPLTYIIQFSHVGKYTFVEEKTFITPPDLPPVPHNKVEHDKVKASVLFYLLFFGCVFLISPLIIHIRDLEWLPVLGLVFFGIAAYLGNKDSKINEYNKKCEEELKLWNEAWDNWRTSIFLHSFQENVNGQLSRIFDSVFSCINQINDEKFKEKKTLETQESSDMNELEQMISRKQTEYR